MTVGAETVFARRRRYWANGYRPIEVWSPDQRVNDKGDPLKSPGKQPRGKWCEQANRDPPAATEKFPDARALNTGVLCGEVVAFDVDVPVQELADQIVHLIEHTLGPTPLIRVGMAPKILLVYRPESPFSKVQTPELLLPNGIKVKVELLAQGQQFVADGIHPKTGEAYSWTNLSPEEARRGGNWRASYNHRGSSARTHRASRAPAADGRRERKGTAPAREPQAQWQWQKFFLPSQLCGARRHPLMGVRPLPASKFPAPPLAPGASRRKISAATSRRISASIPKGSRTLERRWRFRRLIW